MTDSELGHAEGEAGKAVRKRTKKERKRTNLGPKIKVLRLVPGEEIEDTGDSDLEINKTGVKVECQMETSKQKTVTFEFNTTDIVPEEMATTFIREDLLAEEHRTILVEQLKEIVTQLANNPDELPTLSFPPEECFSPTRDKRDQSSEAPKTESAKPEEKQQQQPPPEQQQELSSQQQQQPPVRGAEKPPETVSKVKRFQVSPVVENKPIIPPPASAPHVPPPAVGAGAPQVPAPAAPPGAAHVPPPAAVVGVAPQPAAAVSDAVVKEKTKLEKLDITKTTGSSVSTSLSPGTVPLQHSPSTGHQTYVTSPETGAAAGHHLTHPSSDVSDLEANLAMVFNTKIPAPSIPPVNNVQGIVPLDTVSEQSSGAVALSSQFSEASDSLAVTSETDAATSNSNTVHSTKSLDDCLGEPVKQSTPVVTPDKSQESSTNTAAPAAAASSRFAVKKVEDLLAVTGSDEPELTALSLSQTLNYQRAAAEAEHYNSSPSPRSCYDTTSESVEPDHHAQVSRAPPVIPHQTPR